MKISLSTPARLIAVAGLASLGFSAPVLAQSRPNFSGTWTFNLNLTTAVQPGRQVIAANNINWPSTLVITQTGDQIKIDGGAYQQLSSSVTYQVDGVEVTLPGPGGMTIKGSAMWNEGTLIIRSVHQYNGPQGPVSVSLREVYKLDGEHLTIERTETQQDRSLTRNIIYNKGGELKIANRPSRERTPQAANGPVRRLPDGKPDFGGYWQAQAENAMASVEAHAASFAVFGGDGVITEPADGKLPYQDWARKEHKLKAADIYNDPEPHCFPSGVPRQMYVMPYQILQNPSGIVILYEYIHARRIIKIDPSGKHATPGNRFWQGDSVARWDGDTLVVDSTNFNGRTWLDMDANFVSDAEHVVEKFRMLDGNTMRYEATIEDPKVYTKPWTMLFFIERQKQPGFEILESACHEDNRDLEHLRLAVEAGIK